MANIVNFGRTELRESPLSGVSEGLSEGIKANIDIQTLKQRERERVSREKAEENTLAAHLADQELRKREQDIQNVRKTHESFSMWWKGMDEQQKAIAKTSEQYKELQKFFKNFKDLAPGLVQDDGTIVAASSGDIMKKKLEDQVAQAKMNIASGNPSEYDKNLLMMEENIGSKALGEAMGYATDLIATGEADIEDFQDLVQRHWELRRRALDRH